MVNRGKDKSFVNLAPNIGTGINKIEGYKDSKQVIIGWGSLFVDYDHDKDLDLFNSNGPINPMTNRIPIFCLKIKVVLMYVETLV